MADTWVGHYNGLMEEMKGASCLKARLIASALNKYRPSTCSGTTTTISLFGSLPNGSFRVGFAEKRTHIFRPFRAYGSTALVS